MRIRVLSAIALAFLMLASCRMGHRPLPVAGKAIAPSNNDQYIVIGTMENRDRIVTVKTGQAGVVYSIATKDGKSLYENISPATLKAEAPALHEFIERGTASYAGMGPRGVRFDAPTDARK